MTTIETLLRASVEIAKLKTEIARLRAENARLRERDQVRHDFDMDVPVLLKRHAE